LDSSFDDRLVEHQRADVADRRRTKVQLGVVVLLEVEFVALFESQIYT